MTNLINAKHELLSDGIAAGNMISIIGCGNQRFVKARRGYSHPEETRAVFMKALDELIEDGELKILISNNDLEVFEVVHSDNRICNKYRAKEFLLKEIQNSEAIYKIHSKNGEYLQVGDRVFSEIDEERVLLLMALADLVRHGDLKLVHDSSDFSQFKIGDRSSTVSQSRLTLVESVKHAA